MPRGEVECVTLRSTSVYNKPVWKLSMEEIPQLLHSSLAPPRGAGGGVLAGGWPWGRGRQRGGGRGLKTGEESRMS